MWRWQSRPSPDRRHPENTNGGRLAASPVRLPDGPRRRTANYIFFALSIGAAALSIFMPACALSAGIAIAAESIVGAGAAAGAIAAAVSAAGASSLAEQAASANTDTNKAKRFMMYSSDRGNGQNRAGEHEARRLHRVDNSRSLTDGSPAVNKTT
jgi:hypothetical protein